ncbi:putative antirepressor [Salmonella phage 118970_sal3]|nr:putative antirepressor [Salmonella phage 118970_sal3]AOP04226.1 putative antirepressor [Salmonella phage 118970_sal3]
MNSLTVNNRLSQQPGMYEYRPLRHECRLPNSLVVRNHREHSLTVGDESCRNLTAGFGMEGDFMFHVIRWEPETERVIYLRKGYPHECFSPLWKFRRDFVECEAPGTH